MVSFHVFELLPVLMSSAPLRTTKNEVLCKFTEAGAHCHSQNDLASRFRRA